MTLQHQVQIVGELYFGVSVGTFTARGTATVYAAILDGALIAADQLAELSAVAFEGTDQVFGNPAVTKNRLTLYFATAQRLSDVVTAELGLLAQCQPRGPG